MCKRKDTYIMKKTFKLEGLDCANCAAKMETAISKLDGINAVSVNFMTTKLTIEADEDKLDMLIEAAGKIVKKIEPDVIIKKA